MSEQRTCKYYLYTCSSQHSNFKAHLDIFKCCRCRADVVVAAVEDRRCALVAITTARLE